MGGTKSEECLREAIKIWEWAQDNKNWLTITHIPGVENVLADLRSRKFRDHLEWRLNTTIFDILCNEWGTPEVDMFVSRLNTQIEKYVTENWRTNAFSFKWSNMFVYCFPPFSLIPRVLRKIQEEGVAPHWPAQPWHPLLQERGERPTKVPKMKGDPLWNRRPEQPKKRCRTTKCKINGLPLLVRTLEGYSLNNKTLQFLKHTWRDST